MLFSELINKLQEAWRKHREKKTAPKKTSFWPRMQSFNESIEEQKDRSLSELLVTNDTKELNEPNPLIANQVTLHITDELPYKTPLANSCFLKIKGLMARAKQYEEKRRVLRSNSTRN